MANPDFARGLQIWGPLLRAQIYSVVQSVATAMYHGDMVETVSTGIASKYGNYISVISEETGAVSTIVGAVIALFDENMDPVAYIAASEAGDDTVAGYALVADHPEQLFVIQEDGTGGVCGIADAGQNADVDGIGGSTATGLSTMEMDSSTVTTTSTLALKLINPVPDQDPSILNCDWIVKINAHFQGQNVAGI